MVCVCAVNDCEQGPRWHLVPPSNRSNSMITSRAQISLGGAEPTTAPASEKNHQSEVWRSLTVTDGSDHLRNDLRNHKSEVNLML